MRLKSRPGLPTATRSARRNPEAFPINSVLLLPTKPVDQTKPCRLGYCKVIEVKVLVGRLSEMKSVHGKHKTRLSATMATKAVQFVASTYRFGRYRAVPPEWKNA